MACLEVWLVRHTAVAMAAGVCYGRLDVPLGETFEADAAAVSAALAEALAAGFDGVWSSPSSRCTRLAEACGFAAAVRDERLLEMDFGEWEGRAFDRVDDPAFDIIDDPALERWYADWLHARPTGGETFDEQRARVANFLDELRRGADAGAGAGVGGAGSGSVRRHLVFTHGGVMAAAAIHAGLVAPEDAFRSAPKYGEILKISL